MLRRPVRSEGIFRGITIGGRIMIETVSKNETICLDLRRPMINEAIRKSAISALKSPLSAREENI